MKLNEHCGFFHSLMTDKLSFFQAHNLSSNEEPAVLDKCHSHT